VCSSDLSEFVDSRRLSVDVDAIVREAYLRHVAPHFGVEIEWFELPEILRYGPGGEYKPHADAEEWRGEGAGWMRGVDRDLSVLIYLNDGYGGGQIDFPNFRMQLPPQRGMLVAFPSDHRYLHAARPVTSGVRLVVVSWAKAKGSPTVRGEPPAARRV